MYSRNILTALFLITLIFGQVYAIPLLGDKQQREAKRLWKQGKYLEAIAVMRKRCCEMREGKKSNKAVRDLISFVKKTPQEVVSKMEELCREGNPDGCADMGWYLLSKKNGFCVEYFRKACEYGDAFCCNILGTIHLGWSGLLHRDCKKSEYFLQKACRMGEMHACYNLGILYKKGCGDVKKNKELSRKYLKKACSFGMKDACWELKPVWRKVLGF